MSQRTPPTNGAGPCISTDTACSSSLVAAHLAHRGLLDGEADASVVGGTNLMLDPATAACICLLQVCAPLHAKWLVCAANSCVFACLQALSPVGRCKSFDASGDGYGRGEGFIAAVMQHHQPGTSGTCMALLLGSAVNQAGKRSGLTAPNGPSQTALLRSALDAGDQDPASLRFVSVHGTGTALGDPIEVGALAQALPGSTWAAPLTLVSNKSCFGHTEGTAGLMGLLLAASVAGQQAVPAILHLRNVNPYVESAVGDWVGNGRRVVELPRQLHGGLQPGLAGTSSFGMSGVNAHMLVDAQAAEAQASSMQARCDLRVPVHAARLLTLAPPPRPGRSVAVAA